MVRMTLRLNKELDNLLEQAKRKERNSKNALIIRACEELLKNLSDKNRQRN